MLSRVLVRTAAWLVGMAGTVLAVPGDLDMTFGSGGRLYTTFGAGSPNVMARQPDGDVVMVTYKIRRLRPDATFDPAFGTGGAVDWPWATGGGGAALALQPGGEIVVVGEAFPPGCGVVRLLADGSLDPSFGSGGTVVVTTGDPLCVPRDVLVLPDGKLMVAGFAGVTSSTDFVVFRLDAAGALDPAFGTGGIVRTDLAPGRDDQARALALQSDGKVIAVGYRTSPSDVTDAALVRYATGGALDPAFGTGGTVTTDLGGYETLSAVLVQPDGRIVVAGGTGDGGVPQAILARYDTGGSLDGTFGTGGVVFTSLVPSGGGPAVATSRLLRQPDGKLILAAVAPGGFFDDAESVSTDFALSRWLVNGTPDASFGRGGTVKTPFGVVDEDFLGGVILEPNGRLLAAGNSFSGTVVARYVGGECGNGATEYGEDCDDGNLAGGDGCDARCCVADTDGDGRCDAIDPCATPAAASSPRLTLARLPAPGGDDKLALLGSAVLPFPFNPPLDPATNGVRIMIDGADGPLMDLTVPGGAYARPPGVGWKVRPGKWTYVDRRAPSEHGRLYGGIAGVVVQDLSAMTPGLVRVSVTGKSGSYAAASAHLPLSATVLLDPPVDTTSQCVAWTFPGAPAPGCTYNPTAGNVRCR